MAVIIKTEEEYVREVKELFTKATRDMQTIVMVTLWCLSQATQEKQSVLTRDIADLIERHYSDVAGKGPAFLRNYASALEKDDQ